MGKSVRTSILLGVVAALLLGYILLIERGGVTSGELEQHKGSAVPELVRTRIARIELQRKGATTVLARNLDDFEEGGLWRVESPYKAKADSENVEALLSAFEYVDAHRRLEGISAADRKRFGFDTPRFRVTFTVGKTRIPILVGNPSPRGDGVYLQAADRRVAFVVGKDVLAALDHESGDYHSKELHDGVLVSTSIALSLRDEQGERAVQRQDDELWAFTEPRLGLASLPAVSEIINSLDALRAKHFVADDAKGLARYGLDQPRFELNLRRTRLLGRTAKEAKRASDAKPPREEVSLRLRVGSACQGQSGESYVTIDDTRTVSCAADADLSKMRKSLADLRESRLLPFDDSAVQSLRIEQNGRQLALTKNAEGWSYATSGSGGPALNGQASQDAVTSWLKALRETKAERFEPSKPSFSAHAQAFELRVERAKGKTAYIVRVDASRGTELVMQRGDEPQNLILPGNALELLEPAAARFRPGK